MRNFPDIPRFIRTIHLPALDAAVWAAVGTAGLVGLGLLVWLVQGPRITIDNGRSGDRITSATSPLTGQPCPDPLRRPVAVMLASDEEARPLSGLEAADLVFEMPVTPNGITRLMAVYQCQDPGEVGSIRSARMDFIPLVQGLRAVYAHWGGERDALELLDAGATDNIDALRYEGTVYYRKGSVPRPHNGFTTLSDIREKALDLGYAATTSLDAYVHTKEAPERNLAALATEVTIAWPQEMSVAFHYDPETNTYLRWRGGRPETDRATKRQIDASVIIVMDTDSHASYDQYLAVRTTGQGRAVVYQNGRRYEALWKKPTADAMLTFASPGGRPLPLAPGTIWIAYDPILPHP